MRCPLLVLAMQIHSMDSACLGISTFVNARQILDPGVQRSVLSSTETLGQDTPIMLSISSVGH